MRFHNINIRNILSEALNYGGIIVDVRTSEEFAKSHIPMKYRQAIFLFRKEK